MLDKREAVEKNPVGSYNFFLRNLAETIAKNWKWYALSISVCLAASWWVVKTTPSRYQMQALLQINTNSQDIDKQLNLSNTPSTTNQEVYVLKSSQLMQEVVKQLDLCTSYITNGLFQNGDWYDNSPIKVKSVDGNCRPCVLDINMDKASCTVTIDGDKHNVKYGQEFNTKSGKFVVEKLRDLKGFPSSEIHVTISDLKQTTERYLSETNVNIYDDKAGILSVTVTDLSQSRSEDIANTLLAVYDNYCITYNNRVAQSTSDFIQERLKYISADLANVDEDIANYKKTHKMMNIESQAGSALSSENEYNNQLTEINSKIQQAQSLMTKLRSTGDSYKLLPTTFSEDAGLQGLISEHNQLVQNRIIYVEKSSDHSPMVLELNSQIDALKSTILQSLQNYVTSLNIQSSNIRTLMARSSSVLNQAPTSEKEIQSISRQQKIKEDLYLTLLSKREENAINLAMKESNTRVIEYAKGGKIFPKPSQIYTLGLLLALLIPSLVIFLVKMLDIRIRSKKDITDISNIPVSAIIPRVKEGDSKSIADNSDMGMNEAFRFFSSNIRYLTNKKDSNVLMFTSNNSGDGKTFVAYNLAISMTQARKKVILVNADMRKHEHFGDRKSKSYQGVSTWLSQTDGDPSELIEYNYHDEGFDVIHNGPIPPNPSDLLVNGRFDTLISDLRQLYDIVIIDTAPFGIVSDSFVIHELADATFYVINNKKSDKGVILDLNQIVQDNLLKNVSIVMNGYNQASHYGYGKYGKYGYYKQED